MSTRVILVAGALTAALISPPGHAGAAQERDDPSWQPLMKAVQDYIVLRDKVMLSMGGPIISRDARVTFAVLDQMAANIRAARASAKEGDILGGTTGQLLQARIVVALRQPGSNPEAFLAACVPKSSQEDRPPQPLINKRYSWAWPSLAPPSIHAALPEMPDTLEYRFIGRDLVLVDIDANIIVDVLRDAVPLTIDEEDQ